jgi:hypothetical protein
MASPTEGRMSRESSVFEPPEYRIFHASDHTLQWEPPAGSKDLAIALSYHFPLQKDLESKMRVAMMEFLQIEARILKEPGKSGLGTRSRLKERESSTIEGLVAVQSKAQEMPSNHMVKETQIRPSQDTSKPSTISEPTLEIIVWNEDPESLTTGRKKRRYERSEAAKVAANRGYACEEHRKRKIKVSVSKAFLLPDFDNYKCDPQSCPMNGQSTKLSQPRTHEREAKMRRHDQPSALILTGGPLLETRSDNVQMAPKTQVSNNGRDMDNLNPGMRGTVAPVLNNTKSKNTISEGPEESPAMSQSMKQKEVLAEVTVPKDTALSVFNPVPSSPSMLESWEYPSWRHDALLFQNDDWNFDGIYTGDNYASDTAQGDSMAQKDLDTKISRKRILRFRGLPIHRFELQQHDYLTSNERIIDKHSERCDVSSSKMYGSESQKISRFCDENAELAQEPIPFVSCMGDKDKGPISGSPGSQSSSREAVSSAGEDFKVAMSDEDEIEGQAVDDLAQNSTSLIEKIGFMYI